MSPAWRMPSNSMNTFDPAASAGSLKCFRYQLRPLYVPRSPPLWSIITRNESTSLNECGVLTVSHRESSNNISWASGTSWRMNFQPELKLYVTRGDAGGVYRDPAAHSELPERTTVKATRARRAFDFMRASLAPHKLPRKRIGPPTLTCTTTAKKSFTMTRVNAIHDSHSLFSVSSFPHSNRAGWRRHQARCV